MRITGKQLRQVIREEIVRSMRMTQKEGLRFEPELVAEEDKAGDKIVPADVMTDEQVFDSVSSTVKAYAPRIKAAFEQALKVDPELKGKLEASWVITKGAVSDVKIIENTTGSKSFGESAERAIASWKFNAAVTVDIDSYTWYLSGA